MSEQDTNTSANTAEEADSNQNNTLIPQKRDKKDIFDDLFCDLSLIKATDMSRKERKENNYQSSTLVYGEIEYSPFVEVRICWK